MYSETASRDDQGRASPVNNQDETQLGIERLGRVVCAPDSFKETLSARAAASAMAAGVARVDEAIVCDQCPVADGGEGSLDALVTATKGTIHRAIVTGPLGQPIEARYGIGGDRRTGFVELAEASGLALIAPDRRDPTRTTTFGTGELIAAARERGCETIVLCIGGSGTVDGGVGIAQALGAKFFDASGRRLDAPLSGGRLLEIASYEPPASVPKINVACDVTNPLCGPQGAAVVYAPQKGATAQQVRQLDAALRHLASLTTVDPNLPGTGAAGGAGFALAAFCGATLQPGIELILEAVQFRRRCQDAVLVLTGEGCLDAQSLHGKATIGVARAAAQLGVPTIAIVGRTGPGADAGVGPEKGGMLAGVISLSDRYGLQRSMTQTATLLTEATAQVIRSRLR